LKCYFPDPDRLIVAYSGGKDSLVLADVAVKQVKEVKLFFMYFIAGLDYTEHWCQFAEDRWGVKVVRLQHWCTGNFLRTGTLCNPYAAPAVKLKETEDYVRLRCAWYQRPKAYIAYGYRRADSRKRRAVLAGWGPEYTEYLRRICAPLADWSNQDIKAYLNRHGLASGSFGSRTSSGISLSGECLSWMRREWPEDYRRMMAVFPNAIAQADRYEDHHEEWARRRIARLGKQNPVSKIRVPGDSPGAGAGGQLQSAHD
jgi:phosphoadenosine phosphosulfate reductase